MINGKKIGELPSTSYQEVKDIGKLLVSTGEGSFGMPVSELHDDATECDTSELVFLNTATGDDTKSGISKDSAKKTWLAAIVAAAEQGKWVCPVNDAVFNIDGITADISIPVRIKCFRDYTLVLGRSNTGYGFASDVEVETAGPLVYTYGGLEPTSEVDRYFRVKAKSFSCGGNTSYGNSKLHYDINVTGDAYCSFYYGYTAKACAKSIKVVAGGRYTHNAPTIAEQVYIQADGGIYVSSGLGAKKAELVSKYDINFNGPLDVLDFKATSDEGFYVPPSINSGYTGAAVVLLDSGKSFASEASTYTVKCKNYLNTNGNSFSAYNGSTSIVADAITLGSGATLSPKSLYMKARLMNFCGIIRAASVEVDIDRVNWIGTSGYYMFSIFDETLGGVTRASTNPSIIRIGHLDISSGSRSDRLFAQASYDSAGNLVSCSKKVILDIGVYDNSRCTVSGGYHFPVICGGPAHGILAGRIGSYLLSEKTSSGSNVNNEYPWDLYCTRLSSDDTIVDQLYVGGITKTTEYWVSPGHGNDLNSGRDRLHPVKTGARLLELNSESSAGSMRIHVLDNGGSLASSNGYTIDFRTGTDSSPSYGTLQQVEFIPEIKEMNLYVRGSYFNTLAAKGFNCIHLRDVWVEAITDLEASCEVSLDLTTDFPHNYYKGITRIRADRFDCGGNIHFSTGGFIDIYAPNRCCFGTSSTMMAEFYQVHACLTSKSVDLTNARFVGQLDVDGMGESSGSAMPKSYPTAQGSDLCFHNFKSLSIAQSDFKQLLLTARDCEGVSISNFSNVSEAGGSNGMAFNIDCGSLSIYSSTFVNASIRARASDITFNSVVVAGNNESGSSYSERSVVELDATALNFLGSTFANTALIAHAVKTQVNSLTLQDLSGTGYTSQDGSVHAYVKTAYLEMYAPIDVKVSSARNVQREHSVHIYADCLDFSGSRKWLSVTKDPSYGVAPSVYAIIGHVKNEESRVHVEDIGVSASSMIKYLDESSVPEFVGATSSLAGTSGLVPAPVAGEQGKVLSGSGAWVHSSMTNVVTTSKDSGGVGAAYGKVNVENNTFVFVTDDGTYLASETLTIMVQAQNLCAGTRVKCSVVFDRDVYKDVVVSVLSCNGLQFIPVSGTIPASGKVRVDIDDNKAVVSQYITEQASAKKFYKMGNVYLSMEDNGNALASGMGALVCLYTSTDNGQTMYRYSSCGTISYAVDSGHQVQLTRYTGNMKELQGRLYFEKWNYKVVFDKVGDDVVISEYADRTVSGQTEKVTALVETFVAKGVTSVPTIVKASDVLFLDSINVSYDEIEAGVKLYSDDMNSPLCVLLKNAYARDFGGVCVECSTDDGESWVSFDYLYYSDVVDNAYVSVTSYVSFNMQQSMSGMAVKLRAYAENEGESSAIDLGGLTIPNLFDNIEAKVARVGDDGDSSETSLWNTPELYVKLSMKEQSVYEHSPLWPSDIFESSQDSSNVSISNKSGECSDATEIIVDYSYVLCQFTGSAVDYGVSGGSVSLSLVPMGCSESAPVIQCSIEPPVARFSELGLELDTSSSSKEVYLAGGEMAYGYGLEYSIMVDATHGFFGKNGVWVPPKKGCLLPYGTFSGTSGDAFEVSLYLGAGFAVPYYVTLGLHNSDGSMYPVRTEMVSLSSMNQPTCGISEKDQGASEYSYYADEGSSSSEAEGNILYNYVVWRVVNHDDESIEYEHKGRPDAGEIVIERADYEKSCTISATLELPGRSPVSITSLDVTIPAVE